MFNKMLPCVAAILLLAACQEKSNTSLNYNIVEFKETATLTVPNDTMHATLTILSTASNREAASHANTQKFNAVKSKIGAEKQIVMELSDRSVSPHYGNNGRISQWQDRVQLRVNSTDFDVLSKMLAAVQEEAMIDGIAFSVSPEKRAKTLEQASEQVLGAYKQRADFMREKLGYSGYKVVKLELKDDFSQRSHAHVQNEMAAAVVLQNASASMDVAEVAGEQEVRQTLNVSLQMQ